jgi:hypothetical protein
MQRAVVRRPVYPSDFRALFQALARMAVATSCGLGSGCSVTAIPDDSSAEPGASDDEPAGGAASTGGSATSPNGGNAGDAGRSVSDPAEATRRDAAGEPARDAAEVTDGGAPTGAWVPLACSETGGWPFEKAKLRQMVDYVAHYAVYLTPAQEMALAQGREVDLNVTGLTLYGRACDGATDEPTCLTKLEQQVAATKCTAPPCAPFALVSAGDSVMRLEKAADFTRLLGAIDAEVEAALLALNAGGSVVCWRTLEGVSDAAALSGTRIRAVEDGYEVETHQNCYGELSTGTTLVSEDGEAKVLSKTAYCLGRRPDGMLPTLPCVARTELGAHFASAAQLETASVFAFEQLARDLTRLGAPIELVRAAQRSAIEEVGHARLMGALALRFGGQLAPARMEPTPPRDALAIALENAVEGCVRETYGALLACHQAENAQDQAVRAAMDRVFEDETRHAQLAWEIAHWLEPRLSESERAVVQRARRAAYAQLRSELEVVLSGDARLQIGMPSAAVSEALLAQLDQALNLQAA